MTTIYLDNVDKGGVVTYLLFDRKTAFLKDSQLTREIIDHMLTGTYTLSILPDHAAYDKILLKRSVVRVVDGEKTVFRGDVISIDTDKFGVKKVTCQSDIKWLVDVPDVFSKIAESETRYYIGTENGVVLQWMRDTGKDWEDGEYVQRNVYEHYEMNRYVTLRYIWSDFGFRPSDYDENKAAGEQKKYTVKVQNGSDTREYEIPIQRAEVVNRGGPLNVYAYYIGNITMAPAPKEIDPNTVIPGLEPRPYDFDPAAYEEMPEGDLAYDVTHENSVALSALDFCIVHYYDPRKNEITGGNVDLDGRNISHLYIALTEPPADSLGRIAWQCVSTSRTTVGSMVHSVFCLPGDTPYGYNKIVEPARKIYRGRIEIDGDVDYSSVDTIYSNVSKWLKATGGYASIRYTAGGAYLDLLKTSGRQDDSMQVKAGDNVSGYSKSEDVLSLYTGVFVSGSMPKVEYVAVADPTGKNPNAEGWYERSGGAPNYTYELSADTTPVEGKTYYVRKDSVTLAGAAIASQLADYDFDSETGIIYHRKARRKYGTVVKYITYDLSDVSKDAWVQTLYNWAARDLKGLLEAFTSFDVSAYDPRLLGRDGAVPVLGNMYKVDVPLWGDAQYLPLTKIVTNHVKPSADKLTFGDKKAKLTDYTAARSI